MFKAAQKLCHTLKKLQTSNRWICFSSAISERETRGLDEMHMRMLVCACTWTAVGGQVAVAGSVAAVTAVDAAVFVVSAGVGP